MNGRCHLVGIEKRQKLARQSGGGTRPDKILFPATVLHSVDVLFSEGFPTCCTREIGFMRFSDENSIEWLWARTGVGFLWLDNVRTDFCEKKVEEC